MPAVRFNQAVKVSIVGQLLNGGGDFCAKYFIFTVYS